MKLTLQNEILELYKTDAEGHEESGKREAEAVLTSGAAYHGIPIKFLYLPKALTPEGLAFVRKAGETAYGILTRVIREYLEQEDYRKLFGFPKELEDMILNRPQYETLLPVCRLDMFLNEDTCEFVFCEFNADGSSAMNENMIMNGLFRKTRIAQQMSEKYDIAYFELLDSWVSEFARIWREGGQIPEEPHVIVADFLEKQISSAEFEAFRAAFEKAGFACRVAEIRDLVYDGNKLSTKDGFRVDAIYRRAVTSDILARRDEVKPFLQAVKDKKTVLIGDFCTQVIHDKIAFKVLHMDRTKQILTKEQWQYVQDHIPYTVELTEENYRQSDFLEEREKWILKPQDSYGAHGIYYGGDLSRKEWEDVLSENRSSGFILQKYNAPWRSLNADFSETDFSDPAIARFQQEEDKAFPRLHSFGNMTGMYLYGGKLAGIYSRSTPMNIISVEGDEHEMVTVTASLRQ